MVMANSTSIHTNPTQFTALHKRNREIVQTIEGVSNRLDDVCTKLDTIATKIDPPQPPQQTFIVSFVLIYLQVVVGVYRKDAQALRAALSSMKNLPMYNSYRQAVAKNPALLKRLEALLDSPTLSTQADYDKYCSLCQELYVDTIQQLVEVESTGESARTTTAKTSTQNKRGARKS